MLNTNYIKEYSQNPSGVEFDKYAQNMINALNVAINNMSNCVFCKHSYCLLR